MYTVGLIFLALGMASAEIFVTDQCDTNCKYCWVGSKKCVECNHGFYPYFGDCLPCSTSVDRCKYCSQSEKESPKTCFWCEHGFFLTENGLCDQCRNGPVSNCAKCSHDGKKCEVCLENYELVDNRCIHNLLAPHPICYYGQFNNNQICQDCNYAVHGCELCSYDGSKCFYCGPGFYLVDPLKCDRCFNGPVRNCDFCSPDGHKCYSCIHGYTLKNNECVPYLEVYNYPSSY